MEEKKAKTVKKVTKKEPEVKKAIPNNLVFSYGEIKIQATKITTREDFDRRFKGKLTKTDINKAWKEAEKLVEKYK